MAEWDRLEERLKDLGDSAARYTDEPLDPALVRQRGASRRHRRWAVTVTAAVVMMISGAAGGYALTLQRQSPAPAGVPSWSPSAPSVESTVAPSARGSLLPTTSVSPERPRSVPLPYATVEPSTPDPSSPSPTPTPTEPTDTPSPTPEPTDSPTLTPEPSPTSVPSDEDPRYTALPVPSDGVDR